MREEKEKKGEGERKEEENMSVQYYEAVGRRKESTARVRVMGGSGRFIVNEKEAAVYFPRVGDLHDILRTFAAVGQDAKKYDITVKVMGGGVTGQLNGSGDDITATDPRPNTPCST